MREIILIIDDEQDIVNLLSNLLKNEGYQIVTASNGREGIERFQEFDPGLIITDIRMPVMDGIEVLREVKTKEANTDVIILTGHSDEATAIDCLRHGAYDYFRKPLEDIDVLLNAVHRVIEKRKLEISNRCLIQQLEELSIKDPLTGLYNYRYLQNCLDQEIELSNRYGRTFFVLVLDIDQFKNINETHGHLFGDHVLTSLSGVIQSELRASDRIFRYGGEEFLIIMNEISKEEIAGVIERLMTRIHNYSFTYEDRHDKISVSMGGAFYPQDALDKTDLIKAANKSLAKAKDAGKHRNEPPPTNSNDPSNATTN